MATVDVEQGGCEHVAIAYSGVDDLCARLAPSLRRAAEERAAVLVCVDEPAAARLRTDFGAAAESFVFLPAQARYATPGVAMAALDRFVNDSLTTGHPSAWSIGSIPLAGDRTDQRWMRYEAAVADVFAGRPLKAVCLYDGDTTPAALQHDVSRAHHAVVGAWRQRTDDSNQPQPFEFCPARASDTRLQDPTPRQARATVDGLFSTIDVHVLGDLQLIVSELITNAQRHGVGPVVVDIWNDDETFVIRVHDSGRQPMDVYADLRPCAGGVHGGFGLWSVGQISDAVHIAQTDTGTSVIAVVSVRHREDHPGQQGQPSQA